MKTNKQIVVFLEGNYTFGRFLALQRDVLSGLAVELIKL